jgi:hypothetical protein
MAAAVLGSLVVPDAGAADVGRLFFTQSERAALERARRRAAEAPTVEPEPSPTVPLVVEIAPAEVLPVITVDGYVRRSGGEPTLWVNGENSYDGNLGASRFDPRTARVRGNRIAIFPDATRTPVLLKPGQTYDPNTATTADGYKLPAPAREIAPN